MNTTKDGQPLALGSIEGLGLATERAALRKAAQDYVAWETAGCPALDPYDTYPSEIWPAVANPARIIALLDEVERLVQEQAALGELLCSVADNLSDMPISDKWASKTARRAVELLERNDYFRA